MEVSGRVLDEGLNRGNFGTSGIVARGTVTKWNCSITEESPGRGGSRRVGEGVRVRGDADNPEVGVLVAGVHGSEEFLYVVYSVVGVTTGSH